MRIAVIDDEKELADTIVLRLKRLGHQATASYSGEEALKVLEDFKPEMVLSDHFLGDSRGLELLPRIKVLFPNSPVVMMTGTGSSRLAVESMKAGAEDYLDKPVNFDELAIIIEKIQERLQLRSELESAKATRRDEAARELHIMAGDSMQSVYEEVEKVADKERISVLIHGETGTGKEHIAKLLHMFSNRSLKPFVEFNCAAFPEHLAESELFGFEAGAFTDAKKQKKGLLESAHGGTVFFDEVGELSLGVQAKILKVLEDKEIRRLGSLVPIPVNIRIVAATNRNLPEEVKAGRFREDLYYRLNVYMIELPPLRARKEDLLQLAKFFFNNACLEFGKKPLLLGPEAQDLLRAYPWPGNVRELRNTMERLAIRSHDEEELTAELRQTLRSPKGGLGSKGEASEALPNPAAPDFPGLKEVLDASGRNIKRQLIQKALEHCKGNKTEAAKLLKVDYKTLYNLSKEIDFGDPETNS
jgi:two-component system response regulator AtoC